jgi:hypothetical protein
MPKTLEDQVKKIVKRATELKNKHTSEKAAKVNYAAISSHSEREFDYFMYAASRMGNLVVDGDTGPIFHIRPMATAAGQLKVLKIRVPDRSRHEMGDADFTVKNYPAFKKKISSRRGFRLMKRVEFELIELSDPSFDVRAYFSNKPIDKELGV